MQFERRHIYLAAGVAGIIALVSLTFWLISTSNSSTSVKFERCDNTSATVEEFKLTNCPWNRCKFERGKEVKVTLEFTADKPFDYVSAELDFKEYSDSYSACLHGVRCPSEAWQRQSYEQLVHIPESMESHKQLDVKFYMYTSSDERLVCLQFPVEIV